MMSHAAKVVALSLTIALAGSPLANSPLTAQNADDLRPGDRTVGAWAGASFYSPVGFGPGHTPDRHLYLMGARGEWILESRGSFALAATMDVIPFAMVSNNPTYRVVEFKPTPTEQATIKEINGSAPVFGAGLSPVGLELFGPRIAGARMYLAGAAGGLWFTRETPEPNARRFNFTFEYGGGFRVPLRSGASLVLGYKYHHLSNAYTAPRNPGLDGNVFYLGFVRRR